MHVGRVALDGGVGCGYLGGRAAVVGGRDTHALT